jgi:hypothetical protein
LLLTLAVLLTLTLQCRDWQVPGLVQHHVPMAGYPTRAEVEAAHRILGAHLARGEVVWVHCQAGIDRTGTVIGAWFAAQGHPPGEVCERLIGNFPAYRRRPAFVDLWAPCRDRIHEFAAAADDVEPGSG